MCGIVGLFLKDKSLEPELGAMLTDMLVTMTDRGPDSAGLALYGDEQGGRCKLTIQSDEPETVFTGLAETLGTAIGQWLFQPELKSLHNLHGEKKPVFAPRPGYGAIGEDAFEDLFPERSEEEETPRRRRAVEEREEEEGEQSGVVQVEVHQACHRNEAKRNEEENEDGGRKVISIDDEDGISAAPEVDQS